MTQAADSGPVAPRRAETRLTFVVPDSARKRAKDPRKLSYVELTIDMEIDADKAAAAAGGSTPATRKELVLRSVVAVDGKTVDWTGAGPSWYEEASPKIRELAWYAFVKIHRTTNAEDAAFLDSEAASAE